MKGVTGYKMDSTEGLVQMVCFNGDDDALLGSTKTVRFINNWVFKQDASNLYANYAHIFIVPFADSIQLCV
jgi:hypothetical protein